MKERRMAGYLALLLALLGLAQAASAEMMARLQRFERRDPRGFGDGMSRYVYVRACSTCGMDPSGMARCDATNSTFCQAMCRLDGWPPPALTVCRNGAKCHCICPAGIISWGVTDPGAGLVVRQCLDVHEGIHVNTPDYACCGPMRGTPPNEWQAVCNTNGDPGTPDECEANLAEFECLQSRARNCNNSANCKDCLEQLAGYVARSNCNLGCPADAQTACIIKKALLVAGLRNMKCQCP
jgi:hypothetical protein